MSNQNAFLNSTRVSDIKSVSWGVPLLDHFTGGLPANDISVIETPNFHLGLILLGSYLYAGLQNGERCAFIGQDTPTVFLENFLLWDMNFEQHLKSEQLVYINYRSNISNEIGLTYHYSELLNELERLCLGRMPQRVAMQQVETLINLNNLMLMNNSVHRLTTAADSEHTPDTTFLTHFVQYNDRVHRDLRISLQKAVAGYFTFMQIDEKDPDSYSFRTDKLPWFNHVRAPQVLHLKEGKGLSGNEAA